MEATTKARIEELANEIARRWEHEGTPMRDPGTRDGDNDRCEMADDIWATLNENISVATEDEIWDVLTKWHEKQPRMLARFETLLTGNGGQPRRFWDAIGETENPEDVVLEILWAEVAEDTDEKVVEQLGAMALLLIEE